MSANSMCRYGLRRLRQRAELGGEVGSTAGVARCGLDETGHDERRAELLGDGMASRSRQEPLHATLRCFDVTSPKAHARRAHLARRARLPVGGQRFVTEHDCGQVEHLVPAAGVEADLRSVGA